ncbi:hypothetical protein [Microbacterium sp. Leaf288]|uniref:hypothetical protein n=1 Tax=Microbacterium sp. Leaf288 TaxID=1736323 RepID=UPI0012F8DD9E|nr:hypothetical protein [Microbacterium sp. Leaf288]
MLVLATAAPAAAASAVNPVITGAFSFFPGGVGGNVFVKYEGGEWQANNLIQVTIASADGVLGTPTTQELGGWNALALLAGSATLQYPVAPPSDDWTAPNLWIPFTAPPTAASVSINGQILGTRRPGSSPGPSSDLHSSTRRRPGIACGCLRRLLLANEEHRAFR